MNDPMKDLIRTARKAATINAVIATGRAMAEHCDDRIAAVAAVLDDLARDVDELAKEETSDKGQRRAVRSIAVRIRAIRKSLNAPDPPHGR